MTAPLATTLGRRLARTLFQPPRKRHHRAPEDFGLPGMERTVRTFGPGARKCSLVPRPSYLVIADPHLPQELLPPRWPVGIMFAELDQLNARWGPSLQPLLRAGVEDAAPGLAHYRVPGSGNRPGKLRLLTCPENLSMTSGDLLAINEVESHTQTSGQGL